MKGKDMKSVILKMREKGKLIGGRYRIYDEIGHHKTARLFQYRGKDDNTNEDVVIKFEPEKYPHSTLSSDYKIYEYLREMGLEAGVPEIKYFGRIPGYNVIVAEILGPSLQKYFMLCRQKFSLKTVCMLAEQMITRLEYLHKGHLVHKNISPMNFFMGQEQDVLYLNNYGLTKEYERIERRRRWTHTHIEYNDDQIFLGNPVFGSLKALEGAVMSRRDDMEAVGWCLVSFLIELPWNSYSIQARKIDRKKSLDLIIERRKNLSLEYICKDLPIEFLIYLEYASTMGFKQVPDYTFLRNLFRNLMKSQNFVNDKVFDWCKRDSDERYLDRYTTEDDDDSDDDYNVSSRRSRRSRDYDEPRSSDSDMNSSRDTEDRESSTFTSPMSKESGEITERERDRNTRRFVQACENESNRKRKIENSSKVTSNENGETSRSVVQDNNARKSRKEVSKRDENKISSSNYHESKAASKNTKTNRIDSKIETETRRATSIKQNLVKKNCNLPESSQKIIEQVGQIKISGEIVNSKSHEGIDNTNSNNKQNKNVVKETSTASTSGQNQVNMKNGSIPESVQKIVEREKLEQIKDSNLTIEKVNSDKSLDKNSNNTHKKKQNDDNSNKKQEKPTTSTSTVVKDQENEKNVNIPESQKKLEQIKNPDIEKVNSESLEVQNSNSHNISKQNDGDDKNKDMDKEIPTACITTGQESEKTEEMETSSVNPTTTSVTILPNIFDCLDIPWKDSDSD